MKFHTLRQAWHEVQEWWRDFFYTFASSEPGFLRLAILVRFLVLLLLTAGFGVLYHQLSLSLVSLASVQAALFLYLVVILFQVLLAIFDPRRFEAQSFIAAQIVMDAVMVAFFYAASGDPKSGVFLLYFLPLLMIARFFSHRAVLAFLSATLLLTGLTWVRVASLADFGRPVFWFTDLVPALGYLGILVLFYLIYHRRRNVVKHLPHAQSDLVSEYARMPQQVFSVDRQLRVLGASPALAARHALDTPGVTCRQVFCGASPNGHQACTGCPVQLALDSGQPVERRRVKFKDLAGVAYLVQLSAWPWRENGQVTGASVWVEDLEQRRHFEDLLQTYTDNVERVIDAHEQENRAHVRQSKKEMKRLIEASTALLTANRELSIEQIASVATELLHCEAVIVRELRPAEVSGEMGLQIVYGKGLTLNQQMARKFLHMKEKSIAVQAFESGEPVMLDDIQAHPELNQFSRQARQLGLRAVLSIPLIAQGKTLGTLTLYRRRRERFSSHEVELGASLANLMAAKIDTFGLMEQIQQDAAQRQRALDALRDLSHQLVPHDDVQSLARLVAWLVQQQLHAEVAAVFLLEGERLQRAAIWGVEPDWFPKENYLTGQGLTGQAVLPGEEPGEEYGRVVLDNAVHTSRRAVEEHLQIYTKRLETGRVAHLIAVPLYGQGGTFGVLRVVNKLRAVGDLDPHGFTPEDVDLMTTIGCMVAVAMENARRLGEKSFLAEVGQSITASLSPEQVLDTSLQRAVEMLDAEAGFILLLDEETGELKFNVATGSGTGRLKGQVLPTGAGVAYQVLESGNPQVLPDVARDARFTDRLYSHTGFTARSLLSVPIRSRKQVVGVIEVVNKRAGRFSVNDGNLLMALAPWTGVAIDNARLFSAERARRLLAEGLQKSMKVLASSLSLDDILERILEHLDGVIEFDTAALFLLEGDQLRLASCTGFDPADAARVKSLAFPARTDIPFQEVLRTREPWLIPDLFDAPGVLSHVITERPIRSWICAPLLFQEEVLGILTVDHYEPNQYQPEDSLIVMAFAQQAAVAISNARQFQREKDRVQSLLDLQTTLMEITLAPDRETTLDRVAEAAQKLMHADMAGVALYHSETRLIQADPQAGFVGIGADFVTSFRFPIDHTGGQVLLNPRVYVSIDALHDPESIFGRRLVEPIGARGVIAAPLRVGEKKVGILYAACTTPRRFSEDEQAYFSILANHAAIAIRNTQLLQDTQRRVQLLDLFYQISVASELFNDREQILNIILTGITAEYGLQFNRAMLLLYDRQQGCLQGLTGIGQTNRQDAFSIWETLNHADHSLQGYIQEVQNRGILSYTPVHFAAKNIRIPVDTGSQEVFSRVCMSGKPLVVDPAEGGVQINANFFRYFDPGKFVLVPLVVYGEVIGLLVADNKFTGTPIGEFEMDMLVSCASQAAAALDRTGLYTELEKRIAVLTHLQEVFRFIADLADPRQVLERIVAAANEVLGADVSYLAPYDMQSGELLVEQAVSAGEISDFQHDRKVSKHGLTTLALEEPGGLVVIEHLQSQPELYSRFAEAEGVRSAAVIRLELQKQILGVLYVNYRRPHLMSDQEQLTLRMFASQAALAINNARLVEEVRSLATQKERNRLREDLHDVLNTYGFKVMVPAELLRDRLRQQGDTRLAAATDEIWNAARHSYVQLERILQDMRDPVLVERGLAAAIQNLLETSKLPGASFHTRGAHERPPADIELMLYRICQEAVSNIIKHAGLPPDAGNTVKIELELRQHSACLLVQDGGNGFEVSSSAGKGTARGMGLEAMRNWARLVGAQLEIASVPGRGTRICVEAEYPIKSQQEVKV